MLIGLALGTVGLSAKDASAVSMNTFTGYGGNHMVVGVVNNTGEKIKQLDFDLPEYVPEDMYKVNFNNYGWDEAGDEGDYMQSFTPEREFGGLRNNMPFFSFYTFPSSVKIADYFCNPVFGTVNAYGEGNRHLASSRFAFPRIDWSSVVGNGHGHGNGNKYGNGNGYGSGNGNNNGAPAPVPEPATALLLGTGLAGLLGYEIRRRKKSKSDFPSEE